MLDAEREFLINDATVRDLSLSLSLSLSLTVAHVMYTIRFKDQGYEEVFVLKHVLESRVDTLMQEVEMTGAF